MSPLSDRGMEVPGSSLPPGTGQTPYKSSGHSAGLVGSPQLSCPSLSKLCWGLSLRTGHVPERSYLGHGCSGTDLHPSAPPLSLDQVDPELCEGQLGINGHDDLRQQLAHSHGSLQMLMPVVLCNPKQDNLPRATQAAWAAAGIQGSSGDIENTAGVKLCDQLHSIALSSV